MARIDFTLSNARRFYSSMGNALGLKGLIAVLKSSFDVRGVTTTPNYSLDIISHSYPLTIPKLTPTLLKENIEDEVSVLKETRILTFLVLL